MSAKKLLITSTCLMHSMSDRVTAASSKSKKSFFCKKIFCASAAFNIFVKCCFRSWFILIYWTILRFSRSECLVRPMRKYSFVLYGQRSKNESNWSDYGAKWKEHCLFLHMNGIYCTQIHSINNCDGNHFVFRVIKFVYSSLAMKLKTKAM